MKAATSRHHRIFLMMSAAAIGLIAPPPAHAASYCLSTFDRLQGVIVYDVAEDSEGGIWLGTETGIWRWRANGFEPVSSPTETTAPSRVPAGWGRGATTIAADSNFKTLWIGTKGGLLALDTNSLEPKPVPPELKYAKINRLHIMPNGVAWAGTDNGLYQLQRSNGELSAVLLPGTKDLSISEFLQTKSALWIGTNTELLEISNGIVKKHFESEIDSGPMTLLEDANGAMWLGLRAKPGLFRWDANGVKKFGKEDGLLNDDVNTIAQRRNGEIWVGTERGAYRYLNGKFQCIDQQHGLEQDDVHSIRVDCEDEIWIGTFGGGLYLLRSPDVMTFSIDDGLSSPFVSALCLAGKNALIVGSLQGYSKFDLTTQTGQPTRAFTHVNAVTTDALGRVWLGGRHSVMCIDTGKILELPHVVNAVAFDENGHALVGCGAGLFVESDQNVRPIKITDDPELAVNAILVESDGSMAIGTESGLWVGRENNWRPLLTDSAILSIARSTNGDYWVGTANALKLVSKTTLETLEEYGGLKRARCIVSQANGLTWCGTEDGLIKLHDKHAHRMTLSDGLPSSDVRGLVAWENGTLFAATTAGLARIDTHHWRCSEHPPRIKLELLSLGETLTSSANSRFVMSLYDQGLVAEVTTLGQRHSSGMQYRYRVPGPMDSWSEWAPNRRIVLPEMKEGNYSVHVSGRNADGILSNEATAFFEVTGPLWQSSWFLASSGVALLVALGGSGYLVRKRTHYQKRIEHSERKYRSLVESIRVIPYQVDAQTGEFQYVGPQAARLLGHEVSAWMGPWVWKRVICGDDESAVRSLWQKANTIRDHCVAEHRLNGANGEFRWVRNIATINEQQNDSLISGLMIDITAEKRAEATEKAMRAELESAVQMRTAELKAANESLRKEVEERRRTEEALRQSEDRFSKLFNRSPVAMLLSTMDDGLVLDANEAHLHLSGLTRDELIGKNATELGSWADMSDRKRFMEQLQRDGSVAGVVAPVYTRDRRLRIVRFAAECIEHNGRKCQLIAALDVTDSHAIEKELENQRRFLRQLIDMNPHFIFAKDINGRFTLANKAVADFFRTTVNAIVGMKDAEFNPNNEEVTHFETVDQEVIRTGLERRVEETITGINGEKRYLDTIKLPLRDGRGEIFGTMGVAMDITAKKLAEEKLQRAHDELELRVQERTQSLLEAQRQARASEELLQRMTDAVPGAVYKFRRTKEGKQSFEFISHGCEELYEVPANKIREDFNLAWAPILAEDEPAMRDSIRMSAETLTPWSMDFRIRTPSGRLKWIRGHSRPEPSYADGTIIWNGILTDVTEEKRMDQALRESNERFSLVAEGALDGLWDATFDATIPWHSPETSVYFSARLKKMLGFEEHEMENTLEAWAAMLHPEDRDRVMQTVEDHLQRRVPFETEYRLMTKAGQYRWFQARGQAVWDSNGQPRRMAGSLNDITRRRVSEEQLRQSHKLEAVGRLASEVAHQFENLLAAISYYTDTAKTTLPASHQAVRALEGVETTSRQAKGLTNSLLTFSHRSTGSRSTVCLQQLVENTATMLGRILSNGIKIELNLNSEEPIWVIGDETQIEQVLLNLATNAQDAMPNGGRLQISLQVQRSETNTESAPTALLVISDNGAGITQENLPRIFEPFFTTKPRGQGTGLGLSLTMGVVHDMGGRIDVESTPGAGTKFSISLPCCSPPECGAREHVIHTHRKATEQVIVIERNPHVRSIMTTTLRAVGCEVRPCARVVEALDFAAARPTPKKLFVVDLDSVSPSEFSRLAALRGRMGEMKMIVIVGTLNVDLKRNSLNECLLLRKPFEMPELTELVEDCLDGLNDEERGNNGE